MNVAIIAAAGKSERMDGKRKQFVPLGGIPVLIHTLEVFENSSLIDKIVLVVYSQDKTFVEDELLPKYSYQKVFRIVEGGEKRQDSVMNGLQFLPRETNTVIVHDGARPLVTPNLIEQAIGALSGWDGVVVAVPVKDTIKEVKKEEEIVSTLERSPLWAAQTPQVFLPEKLMKAHQKARMEGFYGTDDAMLMERAGNRLRVTMGSYENIKITTPEDLWIAEAILKSRGEISN